VKLCTEFGSFILGVDMILAVHDPFANVFNKIVQVSWQVNTMSEILQKGVLLGFIINLMEGAWSWLQFSWS